MMPRSEMATAIRAFCWSSFPMAGPTSVEDSTVKGLSPNSLRSAFWISSDVPVTSPPPRFSRIITVRPSANCCGSLSLIPFLESDSRTAPRSTGRSNFTWVEVPPAKSIPMLAAPREIWISATIPRMIRTVETAYAMWRLAMKSTLVLPSISTGPLFLEALPRLENRQSVEWSTGQFGTAEPKERHQPPHPSLPIDHSTNRPIDMLSNTQSLQLPAGGHPVVHHPGAHQGGEEVDRHAQGERHGK